MVYEDLDRTLCLVELNDLLSHTLHGIALTRLQFFGHLRFHADVHGGCGCDGGNQITQMGFQIEIGVPKTQMQAFKSDQVFQYCEYIFTPPHAFRSQKGARLGYEFHILFAVHPEPQ